MHGKIKEAYEVYNQDWVSSFPSDDELVDEHEFSKKFYSKMEKLIRVHKKPYYHFINTVGKRVAIIILAVSIALFTTVFSVEALRDPAVNYIIKVYERFTTIIFDQDRENEDQTTQITQYYIPGFIPIGFELIHEDRKSMYLYLEYKNSGNNYIFYEQLTTHSRLNIDTEGVETKDIIVNEINGIYFSNKGYNNIIWSDGRYVFYISGEINISQLLKVAEPLKPVE